MYTDVTDKNARFFFVAFYLCTVVIAINLMIAFVIDMF